MMIEKGRKEGREKGRHADRKRIGKGRVTPTANKTAEGKSASGTTECTHAADKATDDERVR